MASFVHLHVHSEYSLLDGLARLPQLCQQAKRSGMEALALTDHGQMYGTIKFHRAAQNAGIKPIYGCEVYQAPRRLYQREPRLDAKAFHLILLAKNMAGYKNLLKLVTVANLEGFYYRPRVDRELLAQYAEGLICLSACLSGEVSTYLAQGQPDKAREAVGWFKEVFGVDNYFLELQRHAGVPELEEVNQQLVALSREFGLRCVATNDVHYVHQKDASTQDLLLAMQTQTTISDPDRMRMGGDDYYLMTPQEMAAHMPEYPEALEHTLLVAEQCDVDLAPTGYHLPKFPVPEPYTSQEYMRMLCERGLERCYAQITPEIKQRLEHELKVIHDMGFDDYFLITHDLVKWCKDEAKMLVGPGRGSGPGSLVAYALEITDLEPLGLGLIFERFLNPGRITMPDIDLDFPEDRRQEVIDYLTRRYGAENTSQIATFGTMAARGAIRDVGRALGIPLPEVDRIAKLIPFGPKRTIREGLDNVPELKELYDSTPYIQRLIDYSLAVQGLSRHLSTHAAGVLISDQPLVEYCPLQRAPKGEGIVSQFCMEDVEEIGLLKLDVLGLSTLTVLDRAFHWIACTTGTRLSQRSIPLDDPDTFATLSSGEVTGVFQVESSGMRQILRDMQPTDFREIIALLALYRPGPMQFIPDYINRKFGRAPIVYHHPSLEPILKETYGIIVYQEQIIQIAAQLAGYAAGEADLMRRAVGKKKKKDLEKEHARFVGGAVQNGIPRDTAEKVFADIEMFADYGFNKPHSAAYAVITLQTAYLKTHYPVEFMAALLSVERGNLEKMPLLIGECRRLAIQVHPPDINLSSTDFVIEPSDCGTLAEQRELLGERELSIRFGLGAIKNVGDGPAAAIVEARGDQPFEDVDDLVNRIDLRQVNKRVLECLIRAGALDSLGERNALLASLDTMFAVSQEIHRAKEIGQTSLFDLNPDAMAQATGARFELTTTAPPLPDKIRLADEKELLGSYMSSHPLDLLSRYVDDRLTPLSHIEASMEGQTITVAGVLESAREITTKKGDPMAFAQLEDLSGTIELVIFPRSYGESHELVSGDALLLVQARVDMRDGSPKLLAESIEAYSLPREARERRTRDPKPRQLMLEIPLDEERDAESLQLAEQVLDLLGKHAGDVPFRVALTGRHGRVELSFPQMTTTYSRNLERELISLVGQEHYAVSWAS
ncbi:MAG: DNA polymerase III subunit alpha [Anaerolineae bacterium]|nr:DNA polymerase III subunit alpha [Anaerolineae bacterium]